MLEITVSEAVPTIEVNVRPELHRVNLKDYLMSLKGRFVGVDFVKQDGSVRALNGRLGVHCHAKGGENKTVADSRPYLTIFDAKAGQYRTLNLATVMELRSNRQAYAVVG